MFSELNYRSELRFLALSLLSKRLERSDGQDNSQDNQEQRPDHLEPVTPDSAGSNNLCLADNGEAQGCNGCAEHEDHREEEHLVVSSDLAKPSANSQHSDTGKQLVGSAEHTPDLAQSEEAAAAADDDHDQSRYNRSAEELRSTGQIFMGLSFRSEEFCKQIAAKTSCRVERGQCKDGDCQGEEVTDNTIALLTCEGCKHGSNTAGKDRRRSSHLHDIVTSHNLVVNNTNSNEGDDAESRLNNHGAVADDLSILLAVELLGRSAGADQRVEAGACAAGNRDEQEREQGLASRIFPSSKCRNFDSGCTREGSADYGNYSQNHHAVEQEGAEVVTRLKKNPYRKQRSYRDIDCNENNPESAVEVQTDIQADQNNRDDADNANDCSRADLRILAVHKETEDNCNQDEQHGGHGCSALSRYISTSRNDRTGGCEGRCNNRGEGCNNQDQNGQRKNNKQALSLNAHGVLHDLADGSTVVTDGCKQSTKVMHGTKEDTTEDAPKENRHPAEDCSLDRSVNRARAGDGGEMVTHQDSRVGRNKVLTIIAGMGRGFTVGIYAPLLCQPAAVENVAESKQHNRDDED